MRLLTSALALVIATATSAAALTQAELDSFLAAAAQVNCTIDESTIGPIVLATGVDEATLNEIIVFLRDNDGLDVTSATSMRVTLGACAG